MSNEMNPEEVLTRSLIKAGRAFSTVFFKDLLLVILCVLIAQAVVGYFQDYDDTDAPNKRSGMILRIDYGTGCQYLESVSGALTERISPSGNHMGCRINR